jgi:flagellin-like protein
MVPLRSPRARRQSTRLGRTGLRRRWRTRRGVSEVVATIILLALTVVLFSAIFAFVTSFPSPPAQSNNQFQATLTYTTSSGKPVVSALNVIHLAGPAVPSSALIYIKSAANPGGAEFANPYTIANGGISGTTWNLGQTWIYSFPSAERPSLPDNFTIYIVSSDAVIFSVILPGQSFVFPPTFIATAISPAQPGIGQAFNITATIAGSIQAGSVYANLAGIWGFNGSKAQQMTYAASSGTYYFASTSVKGSGSLGPTVVPGTFYAFLNATGVNGVSALASVAIQVSNTGVSTPVLAIVPVLSLTPATQFATETVIGSVTYTGSQTGAGVTVEFYANSSGGNVWKSAGPSGATISGPATVGLASASPWSVPGGTTLTTYTITAVTTVAGVGSATGSIAVTPVPFVGTNVTFKVWTATFTKTCTTTSGTGTCPTPAVKLWDNGTIAVGWSGIVWYNSTSGTTDDQKFTWAGGTINAGSFTGVTTSTSGGTNGFWKPVNNAVLYQIQGTFVLNIGATKWYIVTTILVSA